MAHTFAVSSGKEQQIEGLFLTWSQQGILIQVKQLLLSLPVWKEKKNL